MDSSKFFPTAGTSYNGAGDLGDIDINYLETHKDETNRLWYTLLEFLSEDDGSLNEQIKSDSNSLFKFIEGTSDLPDSVGSEDGFFDSIYSEMVATLDDWTTLPISIDISDLSRWEDYPWNESIAQLMQEFYFTLDPDGIKVNEDGWLIETEDGFIDEDWLKAGIKVSGRTDMRVLDVKKADAGNSFVSEEDMYDYFDYLVGFTVTIKERWTASKKLENYVNPYSFKITREEILEKSPLSYNLFFGGYNSEEKIYGLSDTYKILKERLESPSNEIGYFRVYLSERIEELPQYILNGATGELPDLSEQGIYFKGTVHCDTIKIRHNSNPWVIPWYNMDGETYKTVRGEDIKKSVMKLGSNEQEDYGKYFFDFTHKHNTSSDYYNWARLLMPQSKRRVEVEDLNRNFWVIGQTIAAITAYLLDPDGPYGLMIGGLLNEIMQIWENVLMMWGEIAMQTKTHPDIVVDFIYVDGSDLVRQDELYYDNIEAIIQDQQDYEEIFSAEGYGQNGLPYATEGIVRHLIKNKNLEYAIVKQLREYHREKYQDQSAILFPLLRLNNYEENYYSRLICPGYYQYCKNYEDFSNVTCNIIKEEHEGIYYADAYNIGRGSNGVIKEDANVYDSFVPLSKYKESFLAFTLKENENIYYEFDFSIGMDENEGEYTDFAPYVSGIFEYDNESGYGGVNYFEFGNQVSTPNKEAVYALLMPRFIGACTETPYGIQISFSINIFDLARYYLTTDALVKNNQEQYSNYLVYSSNFSYTYSLGDFFRPGAILIGQDVRRYASPPKDKGFIELVPAPDLEFGYYMGDAITNKKMSKKIIYNLKVFETKDLRPSNYPDDGLYRVYYGRENLDGLSEEDKECFNRDRKNDQQALTSFLRNAYDWWAAKSSIDAFWKSDMLSLWNSGMTEDDKIIGFERTEEGQTWYEKKPIKVTREEVLDGYTTDRKKWGAQEDWQRECQDKFTLPPDGGEMTSSTILFVAGKRAVDYIPVMGPEQGGTDFVAGDGFIHHYYRNDGSKNVAVGAAIRMPIPGEEAELIYYPNHVSPTGADSGYNISLTYSERWTWRSLLGGFGPLHITLSDGSEKKNNIEPTDGSSPYYRSQTIYFKNGDNTYSLFPETTVVDAGGGSNNEQYIVMRKIGDTEITPDNWRICNVNTNHGSNTIYATLKEENGKIVIDKYLKQAIGRELSIGYLSSGEYYAQLYRNYIRERLQNLGLTEPQDFIDNEINLIKLCPWTNEEKKAAGDYDLHLETLLFGWLRVVINGTTYTMMCKPYDYYELPQDKVNTIRAVRRAIYSNSKEVDEETLWKFIDIIPEKYWDGNRKPNKSMVTASSNYYHMGSFNGIYVGSVNLSGAAQKEQFWYEDRVIDRNAYSRNYFQQALLARDSSYVGDWTTAIGNMLYCYQDKWRPLDEGDVNIQRCASRLEGLIFPLEGKFADGQVVKLEPTNGKKSISIDDVILFSSTITTNQSIYVYGPRDDGDIPLYARRGIYRYSLIAGEGVNINNEDLGTWPARPANLYENTATNWKDDYSYTQQTVDDLRDGYEIIYVIGDQNNFELYKSHYNKTNDDMRSNRIPQAVASADDKDYNNVLNNQKWSDDA